MYEVVFKTKEGEDIQYFTGTRDSAWGWADKLAEKNKWEVITIMWAA